MSRQSMMSLARAQVRWCKNELNFSNVMKRAAEAYLSMASKSGRSGNAEKIVGAAINACSNKPIERTFPRFALQRRSSAR